MAKIKAPTFDEIVFEFRNKEYGAYILRKKYNKYMTISLLIGIAVICTALITPYLRTKAAVQRGEAREERMVEIIMESLEMPSDEFAPPPPPPPPPPAEADAVQQARYVPPVVVDSVRPEEEAVFMTFDQIAEVVVNRDVDEVIEIVTTEATIEVQDDEEDTIPPFVVVEEMPMFPGGDAALLTYISSNLQYPARAQENNIQGRVFIQFAVTSRGNIGEVRVLRGVDPELDAEAIRVVQSLPAFRPGRQGGVAVPVWYQVPITFQLR